jgi:tRNA (guanosine-2'-O-)-methyltransferase
MQTDLLNKLYEHISPNKKELFEKIAPNRTRHVTAILEDIFQPHNASAVIRSCDCFGIQDIHIIENRYQFDPSRRVHMGASKWVDQYKYNEQEDNTATCINALKEKGYKIIGTSPHAKTSIEDLDLSSPVAFLFGTELEGLSQEAMDMADTNVYVPMYGFTESFNISVSAALIFSQITQRLRNSEINWQLSKDEIVDLKIKWCKKIVKHGNKIEKYL